MLREMMSAIRPLERRADENRSLDRRRQLDQITRDLQNSCYDARSTRPAENGESSGSVVRNGEIPDRRADADVTAHAIIRRAVVHHLTRDAADSIVREVDRNAHRRRITILHREARVERAERELLIADQKLVRES